MKRLVILSLALSTTSLLHGAGATKARTKPATRALPTTIKTSPVTGSASSTVRLPALTSRGLVPSQQRIKSNTPSALGGTSTTPNTVAPSAHQGSSYYNTSTAPAKAADVHDEVESVSSAAEFDEIISTLVVMEMTYPNKTDLETIAKLKKELQNPVWAAPSAMTARNEFTGQITRADNIAAVQYEKVDAGISVYRPALLGELTAEQAEACAKIK